jgi:hypothetical protein
MPYRKTRVELLVLAALSAATLTACGGGSGGGSTAAAPGQANQGTLTGSSSIGPGGKGAVTLNWLPPTQTTDGSPLSNLGGYRVYWGTEEGAYPNSVTIETPGLASYVVEQLTPATWHFVVTAVTSNGIESGYSNVFTKTIQ